MSLLSSVLNKLKKEEAPASPATESPMPPTNKEMAQRFVQFVMIQAQNILLMLGKIPTPEGDLLPPNLESAKIFIEQLEMMQEKTAGNLSKPESNILNQAISQVKMAFMEASGGTPHSMIPSRPMRGMPMLDELDDEPEGTAPAPSRSQPTQAPAAAPAAKIEPAENKVKFSKKYE